MKTVIRTYYGVNIYRNTAPGYRLRYTAGINLASDTLEGIKRLIKQAKERK